MIYALENVSTADIVFHAGDYQDIFQCLAGSPFPVIGQCKKIIAFALIKLDAFLRGHLSVGYSGVSVQIALVPAASLFIQFHLFLPRVSELK